VRFSRRQLPKRSWSPAPRARAGTAACLLTGLVVVLAVALVPLTATSAATRGAVGGTTELVSVSTAGVQGTTDHAGLASVSSDGRYVAFQTANALALGDTNGDEDVYVRDREAGTTTQVSLRSTGGQHNGTDLLLRPEISGDGRFIAFDSGATNLVASDTNSRADVFVRDRVGGTTERVSVSSSEVAADNTAVAAAISDDGRYVAFSSTATNLVSDDDNEQSDVFVRDRTAGTTVRASLTDADGQADGFSRNADISSDGRYVAFDSTSTDLVADDENDEERDVFVRDLVAGTTTLVSVSSAGDAGNGESEQPSISPDGRYVAFESDADTLVAADGNETRDVFLHDLVTGDTVRVSETTAGVEFEGAGDADVSTGGAVVAFEGSPPDPAPGGIYVHDTGTGTTELASLTSTGAPSLAGAPSISYDGLVVGFESGTEPTVPGDDNAKHDVFVRVLGVDTGCEGDGPFPDVPAESEFCGDILWLLEEEITTGYADGTFRPDAPVSRQAMAAFMYRYAGEPAFTPPATPSFSDVSVSHPFFHEIEWMKAEGLSNGYADGTYRPTATITRQAMAAFLYRLGGAPPFPDPATATYVDVATGHPFFTEIEWLTAADLSNGFGDGTFRPVSAVTRERMAAFLHDFDDAGLGS
jgi:hypothetical protein